jgi:glycolate oxidase iron-sulfur subunit
VEYGHLLERAREVAVRANRPGLLTRILPRVMEHSLLRVAAMAATRILRSTGLPGLVAQRLPGTGVLGQARLGMGMVAATEMPAARLDRQSWGQGGKGAQWFNGSGWAAAKAGGIGTPVSPTPGKAEMRPLMGKGARTGLLTGCVQEGLLGRVNRATERVLGANGFSLVPVPSQGCCGALHAHTGDLEGARRLARANIEAFEGAEVEWVAMNAAGCGATMKEYPHLLADDGEFVDRARSLSEKVRDITELLAGDGLRVGGAVPERVTYDAPCHLRHAQRISEEPLRMLSSIPGLELIPLEGADECCGGAGIYGITHPDLGGAISRDKVRAIQATGAGIVATGNPGCMMQIGAGLRMEGARMQVVHPVELLDESYRRGGFYS